MKKCFVFLFLLISLSSNLYSQFAGETIWATGQGTGGYANKHWIGDFNGDGIDDKLQLVGTGDWWVALSIGTSFSGEVPWALNQDAGATKYFVGDFNGDGLSDILSYRISTGEWKVSLAKQNKATGVYSFGLPLRWSINLFTNTSQPLVGDFNGDGKDDILSISTPKDKIFKVALSNGNSFNLSTTWKSFKDLNYDGIYVGDFDGDGDCDLSIYKYSDINYENHNLWFVSLSSAISNNSSNTFTNFNFWCDGQGENSNGIFLGDLNADRKYDKLNFYSTGGRWYTALSDGNSFAAESLWCSAQGENATGVFIGDFDGDNQIDRASYYNNNGIWKVSINQNQQPKILATWFTNWYTIVNVNDTTNLWNYKKRDIRKNPVVGWPAQPPTSGDIYNSYDNNVIDNQIEAMKKAGIDAIVVDITNGWNSDQIVTNSTVALFNRMATRAPQDRLKIAFGLGKEFWGLREFRYPGWYFPGWPSQYSAQQTVLNEIESNYSYQDFYLRYLNRPLIIAYLGSGLDYQDEDGQIHIMKQYQKFTIKTAVSWWITFAVNTVPKGEQNEIFLNGQDTKRFWGWGSKYEQPFNKEQMSIMPGTYIWWDGNPREPLPRYNGDFYIQEWRRILEINPNIVLIADWNNWNEDTAIEGCLDVDGIPPFIGWLDYYGTSAYDWYLQITKYYSFIYKNGSLPNDVYVRNYNDPEVYYWNNNSLLYQGTFPHQKPVISLPQGWLQNHGYFGNSAQKISINTSNLPTSFCIFNNFPNPFNPTTTIKYNLPEDTRIKIKVYDILGKEVAELVNEEKPAGYHEVEFNASNLASGVYLYRIQAGSFVDTKKMILMK
jgi:hypothetical protein